MHGQFTWYEIHTPDPGATKKFYPRLTGWGLQPFDNDYTMFTAKGVPVTGIFRLTDEMRAQGTPPNWMLYVEADDVDATATKAKSLGGSVLHGPADIPGAGRFAVLADPQGAVFGIYKSATPAGSWDGSPTLGHPSWHELMTTDAKGAFAFYGALFGWNSTGEMDMGGGAMYSMFGQGNAGYGGMYNRMPGMEGMPPFWLLYFHVKDVGKAVDTAVKHGAHIHRPRMPIPGGTIAILGDPQGAGFALHDVNSMPAAAPAPPAKKPAATKPRKAAAKAVKKAKPTKKAVKKAKPTKKAVKKAKPTKKAARPTTRKAARKVAKKVARRAARKASRKPAKASTKRAARRGRRPARASSRRR